MGRPLSYAATATQYASDVVSGEIVAGELTQLACQRHLDDLDRDWQYEFDAARADRACRFIGLLPHIKGRLAGQTIRLEPWQIFIVSSIFGWIHRDTGLRRYRSAYIAVARKNAKSTLSSGIALYTCCAPTTNPARRCIAPPRRASRRESCGPTHVRWSPGLQACAANSVSKTTHTT